MMPFYKLSRIFSPSSLKVLQPLWASTSTMVCRSFHLQSTSFLPRKVGAVAYSVNEDFENYQDDENRNQGEFIKDAVRVRHGIEEPQNSFNSSMNERDQMEENEIDPFDKLETEEENQISRRKRHFKRTHEYSPQRSMEREQRLETCWNSVRILGRCSGQLRYTQNRCFFDVWTNFKSVNKTGETFNDQQRHQICMFKNRAVNQVEPFFQKGARVIVMGRLEYVLDRNSNHQSSEQRFSDSRAYINAHEVIFLSPRKDLFDNSPRQRHGYLRNQDHEPVPDFEDESSYQASNDGYK